MLLSSWTLLLLYSTVVRCFQAFPNKCAEKSKAGTVDLPQGIKLPSSFKVSAVLTDWMNNSTMIIDEMRNSTRHSYVIEITNKNGSAKWSTLDSQLLLLNESGCHVTNEPALFTLPPGISTTFPLNVSSLNDIVYSLVQKNITGFQNDARVVSGVEGVGWLACVNASDLSSVLAVEVVYGNESTTSPSFKFENPSILSLALSLYLNGSDINSRVNFSISLDFSPFREPLDLDSHLEIPHGTVCGGLAESGMVPDFPRKFEVLYSKEDSSSLVTSKLTYDTYRNMSVETVIDGRALLLNESFAKEDYLLVRDTSRAVRFVFSSTPSCSVQTIPSELNSANQLAPAVDLFIPQFSTLKFALYSNPDSTKKSNYRAVWGEKVIEAQLHNSTLSTVAIYSKGKLESSSVLAIKELNPDYEDSVDVSSLLRECFNRFSHNLVSFVLKGTSTQSMAIWREDIVTNEMATTLASIPKANISPYRLSFLYVADEEDVKKENTRVVMRVADGLDGSTEMTSSQFIDLLNSTLPSGIKINVSDSTVLSVGESLTSYAPLPPVAPPSFSGYTGGSMLVMGLFMVMLGIVVGAGGVYLVFRRQRISTLAYQVFE